MRRGVLALFTSVEDEPATITFERDEPLPWYIGPRACILTLTVEQRQSLEALLTSFIEGQDDQPA